MVALNPLCNSSSRKSNSLFWSPLAPGTHTAQACMLVKTHTFKKKKKRKKDKEKGKKKQTKKKTQTLIDV